MYKTITFHNQIPVRRAVGTNIVIYRGRGQLKWVIISVPYLRTDHFFDGPISATTNDWSRERKRPRERNEEKKKERIWKMVNTPITGMICLEW